MKSTQLSQWSPLLLRLIIGFGFMEHGWVKFSRGPAGFEKLLIQMGVPFPHFTSWLVPVIELLGGLAIFIGAFTTFIPVLLIGVMLVATRLTMMYELCRDNEQKPCGLLISYQKRGFPIVLLCIPSDNLSEEVMNAYQDRLKQISTNVRGTVLFQTIIFSLGVYAMR